MTDKECFQQHIYQNKLKLEKKRDLNRVAWRFKNFLKNLSASAQSGEARLLAASSIALWSECD